MGEAFDCRVPESEWFDLWHVHPTPGVSVAPGPDEWRVRLRRLLAAWERVEAEARRLSRSHQTWLVIDPADPGQDAVYLHTPNPNEDNFPYCFDGVAWGVEFPEELVEFVAGRGVEFGRSEYGGSVLYWLRRATEAT